MPMSRAAVEFLLTSRADVDEVIEVDPGVRWRNGHPFTRCRYRQFDVLEPQGHPSVVVVTELADNPGLSITNAAEFVWRAIARRLDSTTFIMVEHYGRESYRYGRETETFDVVTLAANGEPEWHPLVVLA